MQTPTGDGPERDGGSERDDGPAQGDERREPPLPTADLDEPPAATHEDELAASATAKRAQSPTPTRAPARRGPLLFLGGPISGILLAIAFSQQDTAFERVLPWFALVPLLISLHRRRHSKLGRWLHGMAFGWIVCGLTLYPLVRVDVLELASAERPGPGDWALAIARSLGAWTVVALCTGAFAAASGPLLRRRAPWPALVGLPILWAGLEFLRLRFLPSPAPWVSLGASLDPSLAEARIAGVVGVCGLGALVVATNSCFLVLLRADTLARQVAFAILGVGIVASAYVSGAEGTETGVEPVSDKLRIALIQIEASDSDATLRLARSVVESGPDLVLFPEAGILAETGRRSIVESKIAGFARRERVDVLAGTAEAEASRPPKGSTDASTLHHPRRPRAVAPAFVYFTREGRQAFRLGATPHDAKEAGESRSKTPTHGVLVTHLGTLGVGVDADFDGGLVPRGLARQGAELLLVAGSDPSVAGKPWARLHSRLMAFRALETGTWLIRATRAGFSAVIDSRGRTVSEAPAGLEWAAVSPVELRDPHSEKTAWVRWGWTFGPIALGCAMGWIVAVLLRDLARRAERARDARLPDAARTPESPETP